MTNAVYVVDWGFVHLAQLALLVAIVAMVEKLLRRHLPKVQFGLWLLVLIKAITPPVWSSPVGLFSWTLGGILGPDLRGGFSATNSSLPIARLFGLAVSPEAANWLLAIWLLGMLAVVGCWIVRWQAVAAAIKDADDEAARHVAPVVAQLSEQLGLGKAPRVIVSNHSLGPAVIGYVPKLILPAILLQNLSTSELKSVIGHELLHVRRYDFGVTALGTLVKVLLWFFPPAWWAVERTIAAAERCVDREVVSQLNTRRIDYASALLRVLEIKADLVPIVGVPGMRAGDVTDERIAAILQDPGQRSPRDGFVAWGSMFLMAAIFLPGRPLDIFGPACTPPSACSSSHLSASDTEDRQ